MKGIIAALVLHVLAGQSAGSAAGTQPIGQLAVFSPLVGREWVAEFPELRARWPEIRGQLLGLDEIASFNRTAYSREEQPHAPSGLDDASRVTVQRPEVLA